MGVEASSYQDLQLGDEIPVAGLHGWTVHDAVGKDGTRVTAFLHDKSNTDADLLQNAAKQLKTLRHPSVLKFLALTKTSAGHILVTEHVTPLEVALDKLSATEIAGGIHNLIEALVFLHDRVGVSHNNVCTASVYVSDDGGWRLGGMDHVCAFHEATAARLAKTKSARNEASLAPEEKAGKIETSAEFGYSRDAFAFGVLAESLLESLCELGDMTKTFELRIQDELLHPDPRMRPHLRTLPTDRLFRNDFLEIVQFLQRITLKSEEEKKVFFGSLVKKLYELPSSLVAARLARPLLSRFVLLDGTALQEVVPHLLTPCKDKVRGEYAEDGVNALLLTAEFKQYVLPELYKIFHVRDAHIRLVLLSRFSEYVDLFDKNSLQTVILPQILLGLRDTNDDLVRASLCAVAELVPILGGDVVIGTHRDKIFAEGIPKFGSRRRKEADVKKDVINYPRNGVPTSQKDIHNNHGKPARTLKDIAKEGERERRREEMKLRNKERRKKREERLKTSESTGTGKIEETSGINMDEVEAECSELEALKAQNEANLTDSRTEKADWSGWGESEQQPDSEQEDYDYDREIEEELQQMEAISSGTTFEPIDRGTPVSVDWSNVPRNSLSPQESAASQKTRGKLKLKSKSKSSPPPKSKLSEDNEWSEGDWNFQDGDHGTVTPRKSASPKVQSPRSRSQESPRSRSQESPRSRSQQSDSAGFEQVGDWEEDWGAGGADDPDSYTRREGSLSKSKSPSDGGSEKGDVHPQSKAPLTLGSEFDIKSIKVKPTAVKADPFDFFSDMEPVIKVKNPLTELAERTDTSSATRTKDDSKSDQGKISFAVQEIEAFQEADGWGDEGWGDDELLTDEQLQS